MRKIAMRKKPLFVQPRGIDAAPPFQEWLNLILQKPCMNVSAIHTG
jgi:hypothetical protein